MMKYERMASMTTSASQAASAEPHAASMSSLGRRLRRAFSSRALVPYLLLAPFLTLFVCFFFAPLFYAFSQSFYRVQRSGLGFGPAEVVWAGADNYLKALRDPDFLDGIRRVIVFGLVQIPVMMILALILALLMDSTVIRLRRFFRLAFFVPYAIPGVVAVIMWGFFYSPGFSPIVQLFKLARATPPDFLGPNMIL